MRVALVALLFAGCVYDYAALGGRGGGGGAGATGGNATGGAGVGSGGRGGQVGSGGRGTGGVATGGRGTGGTGTGGTGTGGTGTGGTGTGGAGTGGAGTGGAAPDLVLWYKFDEESGTTAADSSAAAGSPRNGTLTTAGTGGAVTFSAVHQVGTHSVSMTANAATGGGFVVMPPLAELAPAAVTIATWVYATANRDWQRIFDFGSSTSINAFLTTSQGTDASNTIRFAITLGGNAMEQRIDTTTVLPLNSWHHLAVVLGAGSPYTGTLYLDGVAVGTNPAMTLHASDLGATTANHLGRSQFVADWYFAGQLDDFRVYARALGAAEITALFGVR